MNQMKRRNFLRVGLGSAAVLVAPKTFAAEKALDLSSKEPLHKRWVICYN